MLDNPNLPVGDGTYFDCLENVTERAKVTCLFVDVQYNLHHAKSYDSDHSSGKLYYYMTKPSSHSIFDRLLFNVYMCRHNCTMQRRLYVGICVQPH